MKLWDKEFWYRVWVMTRQVDKFPLSVKGSPKNERS